MYEFSAYIHDLLASCHVELYIHSAHRSPRLIMWDTPERSRMTCVGETLPSDDADLLVR